MNSTGTLFLPSVIRYGIVQPDTYPQDLSMDKKVKQITYRNFSVLDPVSGEKYTCDIVAHFAQVEKNVLQEMAELELVGVRSLECRGEEDGEEMSDVVRGQVGKKEKRVKLGGY